MSLWHYLDGDQQKGPVSEDELRTLASSGRLRPDDLVWTEGMAEWQPARNLDGIQWPANPPPPPPFPQVRVSNSHSAVNGLQQIPNYLPWAIAAALLCCVPTGIASIVYSAKATSAKNVGDYETARKAAENARTWLIISVVLGLIVGVLALFAGLAEA